jgi:hypothetical protein
MILPRISRAEVLDRDPDKGAVLAEMAPLLQTEEERQRMSADVSATIQLWCSLTGKGSKN